MCPSAGILASAATHRNGLAVDAELTRAASSAERLAALAMAENLVAGHKTLGADKGYDTHDFVMEVREFGITPHVAQNAYETETAPMVHHWKPMPSRKRRFSQDGRRTELGAGKDLHVKVRRCRSRTSTDA
jgi:hypothetical protein